MSFFQDKEYEDMDWLNLAVEEPTFSLNDILVTLPNEIEVTPELIKTAINYNELTMDMLLNEYIPKGMPRRDIDHLLSAYTWKLPEDGSELIFNFETEELSEPLFLIKETMFFEGQKLIEVVWSICNNIIIDSISNNRGVEASRINEIADFLNSDNKIRSTRSLQRKVGVLQRGFNTIIKEDKWKIRNMDLLIKSVTWACEYIRTGNLAALTNFNKLKVMTHKKQPIYSMEETV